MFFSITKKQYHRTFTNDKYIIDKNHFRKRKIQIVDYDHQFEFLFHLISSQITVLFMIIDTNFIYRMND